MKKYKKPFAVWLVPAKTDGKYLSGIINKMCSGFNSVPFEPHLTLISGKCSNLGTVICQAKQILRLLHPVTLKITGLGCSEKFFKTLFLEFEHNSFLQEIFLKIKSGIRYSNKKEFHPHLSLLYADISLKEKEKLVQKTILEIDRIYFNRVIIASSNNPKKEWLDIESWEILSDFDLST